MRFDQAMNAVAIGKRVQRPGGMVLYIQSKTAIVFEGFCIRPERFLCCDHSSGARDMPYAVSDEEMKATDWEVV